MGDLGAARFGFDRRLRADRLYNFWAKIRSMTVEAFGVAAKRKKSADSPVLISFDAHRATLQFLPDHRDSIRL